MLAKTSAQILASGAIDAVKNDQTDSAGALFREYLAAMEGEGPHKVIVEGDVKQLEGDVRKRLASDANNGAWWAELDAATGERVTRFFDLLKQAASQIDQIEKPELDPAKISQRIDRNLEKVAPIMNDLYGAFNLLGEIGMGMVKVDDAKFSETLSAFRTLRRRAAEILVPMKEQTAEMTAEQKKSFDGHYRSLVAWVNEVRGGMMLNG
jgi:hypothetical protein